MYQKINPEGTPVLKAGLAGDLRDQRVYALVSLDLGLSRGMADESIAALPVPVLVIAAGAPSVELPAQLESANLATRLPQATSRALAHVTPRRGADHPRDVVLRNHGAVGASRLPGAEPTLSRWPLPEDLRRMTQIAAPDTMPTRTLFARSQP